MAKIRIYGKEHEVPENLTLGELADMEKITGQDYDLSKPGLLGMLALAYITLRRDNANVTIEDVRGLTAADVQAVEEEDASPPQSQPVSESGPDEKSGSSSPSSSVISAGRLDGTREVTGTPV